MSKYKLKVVSLTIITVFAVLSLRHYLNSKRFFYSPENSLRYNYEISAQNNAPEFFRHTCSKTGLSPFVIKKYIDADNYGFIEYMKSLYNEIPDFEKKYICRPFTVTEKNKELKIPLANLQRGDILLTFNTHTLDWRHGHCAIVVDDIKRKILEHSSIGNVSVLADAYEWGTYPSFAVLRYPDAEIARNAAFYAEENLSGREYSIFAGLFGKKEDAEKSNCSHIVWLAYYYAGIDIDGNGGRIVTPEDILSCTSLKVVQLFGINSSQFETRWLMP